MRTRLTLAAGTAALALVGSLFAAAPAQAAADTTDVTFTLTAGALAIDAPASAALAAVATSSTATAAGGQLGNTTVTDGRAALVAAYAVTLTSGNFTTGATPGANQTILGSTVTSFSGPVTHSNPTTTKVAVETTTATVAATPIMSLSAYSGTDTAVYNPTVSIPVPATNVAGAYAGVITQTVTAV